MLSHVTTCVFLVFMLCLIESDCVPYIIAHVCYMTAQCFLVWLQLKSIRAFLCGSIVFLLQCHLPSVQLTLISL